jgi:FtsP/CotA-like multicopper oxidase with cupredoxin domain
MKGFIKHCFLFMLLLVFLGITPAGAGILVQCPTDTDGDGVSDDPAVDCLHLSSGDGFSKMADGKDQYIFSFSEIPPTLAIEDIVSNFTGKAMSPAPTIVVAQDQELYLSLTNVGMIMRPDLFDAHSVHWHGFPNAASVFDGVPEVSPSAAMLATQPYYYKAYKEGTYFYHCHVEASEHMQMGMIGNLYVTPRQNNGPPIEYPIGSGRTFSKFLYNDGDGSTGHDVDYPIQLTTFDSAFHDASIDVQPLPFALMEDNYFMINGRGYPDTVNPDGITNNAVEMSGGKIENYVAQDMNARITASLDDKIALRLSNVSTTDLITVTTTLGVPMRVVARGAELLRGPTDLDTSYEVSVLNIGAGQAYDVIVDTTGVPAGTYFLYTTNLQFLSNNDEERGGIMTEIVIN